MCHIFTQSLSFLSETSFEFFHKDKWIELCAFKLLYMAVLLVE